MEEDSDSEELWYSSSSHSGRSDNGEADWRSSDYYRPRAVGSFHQYAVNLRALADPSAYPQSKRDVFIRYNVQAALDSIHASENEELKSRIKEKKAEEIIPRLKQGEKIELFIDVAYEELQALAKPFENSEEAFQWDLACERRMDLRVWSEISPYGIYSSNLKLGRKDLQWIDRDDWEHIESSRRLHLRQFTDWYESAMYNLLMLLPYVHILATDNSDTEVFIFDYTPTRTMYLDELMAVVHEGTKAAKASRPIHDIRIREEDPFPPPGTLRWGIAGLVMQQRWLEYAYYDRYVEEFGSEDEGDRPEDSGEHLLGWCFGVDIREDYTVLFDPHRSIYPGTRGRYVQRTVKVVEDGRVVERTILDREVDN